MYCQCKGGNNFQVMGLCNPSKFDDSGTQWAQITVPEVLPLPDCYPDIEAIERIYVNLQVVSTKVVSTPVLEANLEGVQLTGRKLLVHGILCQTVVYTANTSDQSLHSVNFKFPFCTAIVLQEDINLDDQFCVESCIEDIYAGKLNDRTLFKSVTVFLSAKVKQECQTIE